MLPAPADGSVAAALDATGGLVQASAEDRATQRLAGEPAARPRRGRRPPVLAADRAPGPAGTGAARRAGAVPAHAASEAEPNEHSHARTPQRRPPERAADRRHPAAGGRAARCSRCWRSCSSGPDDAQQADVPPEETALTRATADLPLRRRRRRRGQRHGRVRGGRRPPGRGRRSRADWPRGGPPASAPARRRRWSPPRATSRPACWRAASATPLVAPECRPPAFDEWFTGVGAGAKHSSVLELVNPDAGPAVVDVIAYGRRGPVDAPALRGVAVPGRSVVHIDLAQRVPRRDDLALHVTTTRGRVSASVLDTYDELGSGGSATDYLPSQPAPATSNLLLGLPEGTGRRTLLLANPAETETRATHQGRHRGRGLRRGGHRGRRDRHRRASPGCRSPRCCAARTRADALGLLVESTAPVTASARFFVDGDLTHAAPPEPVDETSLVVPTGDQAAAASPAPAAPAAVTVVSRDADGEVVAEDRLEVGAGRGGVLDLPDDAVLVRVTTNGTTVDGVGAGHRRRRGRLPAAAPAAQRADRRRAPGAALGRRRRPGSAGRPARGRCRAARPPARRPRSRPAARGRRGSALRCSMGRRNTTSRVGVVPLPRTSEASGTRSVSQSSGICGASSTAYSTSPRCSCQRSSSSVTTSSTSASKRSRRVRSSGVPGSRGRTAGPRIPRPRRSRVRRLPHGREPKRVRPGRGVPSAA